MKDKYKFGGKIQGLETPANAMVDKDNLYVTVEDQSNPIPKKEGDEEMEEREQREKAAANQMRNLSMTCASSTLAQSPSELERLREEGLTEYAKGECLITLKEEKSLGQIAYEKHESKQSFPSPWNPHSDSLHNHWEGIAQAVAEEAIKRERKKPEKQVENLKLQKALSELIANEDEVVRLMERSVLAMHIIEGDEGWEKANCDCPMLDAAFKLRMEYNQAIALIEKMEKAWQSPNLQDWANFLLEYFKNKKEDILDV